MQENNKPEELSQAQLNVAANMLFELAKETEKLENLRDFAQKEEKNINELKNKIKKVSNGCAFLYGLISIPIDFVLSLILYISVVIIITLFSPVVDDYTLATVLIMAWPVFLPCVMLGFCVVGYVLVSLILLLIFKMRHRKEKRVNKLTKELKAKQTSFEDVNVQIDNQVNKICTEYGYVQSIPTPYQTSYAMNKIGMYFLQGRAHTMQEAANLFEDDMKFMEQQYQLQQIASANRNAAAFSAVSCGLDAVSLGVDFAIFSMLL